MEAARIDTRAGSRDRHGQLPLRPPSAVMRLERMGAAFPTRLSFARCLLRRMARERARLARPLWQIGPEGYGRALYTLVLGGRPLSLLAVSTPLSPEDRTDRVIAEAWDTAYVLFDGLPSPADLDRLAAAAPLQEAGRFDDRCLVLSRANRSVRLFEHVVDALAAGRQPEPARLAEIGYLMRTTAVYGNGKFGIAGRSRVVGQGGLRGPFEAEMLTVWLIREFTCDLADHIAAHRAPGRAASLSSGARRTLGIGNSTGLGMAPFLVSHPCLLDAWMRARETALARVRAVALAEPWRIDRMRGLLGRARSHVDAWHVADASEAGRLASLRHDLAELDALATPDWLARPGPWERLMAAAERRSTETQELVAALLLEPYGDLVDDLAEAMATDDLPALDVAMTVAQLRALLASHLGWALAIDFADPAETARFWYVSEEKQEPRLGNRGSEPGDDLELPLDIARQVQALASALEASDGEETVAEFLLRAPRHRHILRRVQTAPRAPYGEIRDNLIGAACRPIDMLRCKLAFFGATRFDPRSDRWTRITLFQGAPTAADLAEQVLPEVADDWWLPAPAT